MIADIHLLFKKEEKKKRKDKEKKAENRIIKRNINQRANCCIADPNWDELYMTHYNYQSERAAINIK